MRLLPLPFLFLLLPSCGAMRVYEGPQPPPNEVALIRSAEHDVLFFSLDTVDLVSVDGENLGLFHDTAEVLPGLHTVTASRGSGTGAKNRVEIALDAKAGHTYEVDAKDLSWSPRVVAIWIVDKKTGAIVAGTAPPPDGETPVASDAPGPPAAGSAAAAAATESSSTPPAGSPDSPPSAPRTSPSSTGPARAAVPAAVPAVIPASAPATSPPPIVGAEELWRGTRRANLDGSEAPMTMRVRPALGGAGRIEEIEVTRPSGTPYRGLFVEAFDEAETHWIRQYVNTTTGGFVRMDGVGGGRAVWMSGAPDRTHQSKLELSWPEPDHCRRVQSVSDDGGRTWRILFSDDLRRATP